MTKTFLLSTALAAGVLLAGSLQPAAAAPLAPGLAQGATAGSLVQNAGWRCGPRSCWWVNNYWGPVPGYARAWGPPLRPDCYWKKGILGNWKQKCD